MNNIYVDELPTKGACIGGCPYAVTDTWVSYCPFQQEENGDHLAVEEDCIKACPLKSLTDRLAEERKKVVQEIRERLTKYTLTNDDFLFDTYYKAVDVEKVLDQIDKFERGE